MKKLFTLTLMSLFCILSAQAQTRVWDFTNWSATTKANLIADASDATPGADSKAIVPGWRSFEKAQGDNPTENKCFWYGEAFSDAEGREMAIDGVVIEEMKGLYFTNVKAGNLAIAIDYPSTSLGEYAGPSYLWVGGSALSFKLKDVKVGSVITLEVESHKLTDGRGFDVTANGKTVEPNPGSNKPKEKTTCVYRITSAITDGAETVDVTFTNNNGCHLYTMQLEEAKSDISNAKMAYILDSSYPNYSIDNDVYRIFAVDGAGRFSNVVTDVIDLKDNAALPTADSLKNYDAVIVSPAIGSDNAYAATLKQIIGYVPMLNMNANLYTAWGYGSSKAISTSLIVPEQYKKNSLFKPSASDIETYFDENGAISLLKSGELTGVVIPEGSYFAKDIVYGYSNDSTVAIHAHSMARNAYLYMPYNMENMDYEDNVQDIIINAISTVFNTKAAIPQTATPEIVFNYRNKNTDVTLKCATSGATIYYTIDGSKPTQASPIYTEGFNCTDSITVKAVAIADGYSLSEIAEQKVAIMETSAEPTIAVDEQDGKTIVTLATTEEGAKIYYNLIGGNNVNQSALYDDSLKITITEFCTLYAFTGEVSGKIQSGTVSKDITIKNKTNRNMIVSHFDGNAADWRLGGEGSSATYYPADNKGAGWEYWLCSEPTDTIYKDIEGNDSIVTTYASVVKADSLFLLNPGKGWEYKSYGQGGNWQTNSNSNELVAAPGEKVYRPESVFDFGSSKGEIRMHNVKKSDLNNPSKNDPYSACLQTTEAIQGPFDITVYLTNGSSGNQPRGVLYVSTDTLSEDNWVMVDTVWCSKNQRWIKKTTTSYEGTDKVFVKFQAAFSSLCINDIIIKKEDSSESGIMEAKNEGNGQIVRTEIYSLNGMRQNASRKGISIVKHIYSDGTVKTQKVMRK